MDEFLTVDDAASPSAHESADECLGELLLDCHSFVAQLLSREQPLWVRREGRLLLERLGTFVDWHTLH
jgi:hypothetical protein